MNITVEDVDEPPGSVEPVMVTTLSSSELMARWSMAPNTGPKLEYQVQYRKQGKPGMDSTLDDELDDALETTISGLDSNTTYQIQVRARNDEGDGPWAEGIGITEKASLTVVFSAAAYTVREGDIATTTVTVTPTADRNVTVAVTTAGAGATLSGLNADNTLVITREQDSISFTIFGDQDDDAVNDEVVLTLSTGDDGVSVGTPSATTITVVDDDEPNSPPEFATTTVELSIPEDSSVGTLLGDPISAIDPEDDPLTYSLSDEGSEYFEVSDQAQITLGASLNHEDTPSYTLTLSVLDNKDDIGNPDSETDASITVNITVEDVDEPPDTPNSVTVSANAANPTTALDASWTMPSTTGIPVITGYDVQYRELGQDAWIDHTFSGMSTGTTIEDLNTGTVYEVQVQANNDEGKSGWSTPGSGATGTQEPTPEPTPQPTPETAPSSGGGSNQESNTAPHFDEGSVTLIVNENSTEGSRVGSPIDRQGQ